MSENFQFLEVKFSIYLNRRVFVMSDKKVIALYGPIMCIWCWIKWADAFYLQLIRLKHSVLFVFNND